MVGADHTIPHTAAIFVTMLHTPHQVNILIIMPAITVTVKRKSHDT
jgi:hypothetical protein